jgi:hypothetical protein
MTDRELLELAAKAAGLTILAWSQGDYAVVQNGDRQCGWSPLAFDSDALRLAVKCGISVLQFPACIGTGWPQNGLPARLIGFDPPYEDISSGQDVLAATRRAIVRAAAEIGRSKT